MRVSEKGFLALRLMLQTFYCELQNTYTDGAHRSESILLSDTSIGLNVLRWYVQSLANCEDVTKKNTREVTKDYGFRRIMLRDGIGKMNGCSIIYVRHATELLRRQVECFREDDIKLRPELKTASSRASIQSLTTGHIRTCYKEVKRKGWWDLMTVANCELIIETGMQNRS